MNKFKPFIVTAGVVVVTLIALKYIKPMLPTSVASLLP